MSVESGGVAGAASVSGAAILGMPSLEAAPVAVNAGLVRSLEGFRPMNALDINTIDFKGGTVAPSQPLVIAQAEEVAAAAWEAPQAIISEAQEPALEQSEAIVVPNIIPVWMPDQLVQPQPQVAPQIVPLVEPGILPRVELTTELQASPALEPVAKLKSQTEQRVHYQAAHALSPQPLFKEQEVEEEVFEKVEHEESKDSLEEEEEETEKRLFLEDEKALAVRKFEIKQAVKLAFASVKDVKLSTVLGSLVARFLPGEHAGNRSQALKDKGPDGSYEETVEAIASSGEFSSPEQAEKKFEEIVAEKKPIKNGKEGSPVTPRDVLRVFRFRAVKPPAAVEIYTKRVVKKQVQVAVGQAVAPKTETNEIPLEELSTELAEVFQKVA